MRAASNIAGATASTYALVAADVGSTIRVVVTGTNAAGNSSADFRARPPSSPPAPPVNTVLPTISGTAPTAQTLTRANGTWTGTAADHLHVPVARCNAAGASCADIAGATGAHLRARDRADVG